MGTLRCRGAEHAYEMRSAIATFGGQHRDDKICAELGVHFVQHTSKNRSWKSAIVEALRGGGAMAL